MKNILYYLEPAIEFANPLFRYATLRNSLLPQIKTIVDSGGEIVLVTSISIAQKYTSDYHMQSNLTLAAIDSIEWTNCENYLERSIRHHNNKYLHNEISRLAKILKGVLPPNYNPDLIIVWETPASYLSKIFPNSKILYQMPGFFSRPPFANMIAMDVGLLEHSSKIKIDKHIYTKGELQDLTTLQKAQKSFLESVSPLSSYLNSLRIKFDSIILFPLQLDNYFMIDCQLKKMKQFDLLVSIIKKLPKNQAIIITNYKSGENKSAVLSETSFNFLKLKFPNIFFETDHDDIPYVSQFIVPFVDGVISISSSVAYQAAFWQKPVFTVGESHISRFATADTLEDFAEQVKKRETFDRNNLIVSMLKQSHLPMSFIKTKQYILWLEHFMQTGCFSTWTNNTLASELIKESREKELLSIMGAAIKKNKSNMNYSEELSAQIAKYDIISFDIFDTLLIRPFQKPTDMFSFIEKDAREITMIPNLDFRYQRIQAEKTAFMQARERGEGETSLHEIYSVIGNILKLDITTINKLIELEMDAEYKFLKKRQVAYSAFVEAVSLKKRIIIVSDMYLPEYFIKNVLRKNGYEAYEKLFLSSTYKAKKHSGELFKIMMTELGVDSRSILHIGDNIETDVRMASKYGIKSFHLRRSFDRFCETSAYLRPWRRDAERHSLDWRIILTIIGNKLNDNPYIPERKGTLFSGDPWKLGYYGLGPLLFGYAKWLIETAIRDGIKKLYFLSRDGKIIKNAYDKLLPYYKKSPSSHYLLCSRRAVNLAKAKDENDLIDLVNIDYANNVTLGFLLTHRFGVTYSEEIIDIIHKNNFKWDTKLTAKDRSSLRNLIVEMKDILLDIATEESKTYKEYLTQCGLAQENKVAIVDIGYAGTMQESIQSLINNKVIGGYYLITFRAAMDRVVKKGAFANAFFANFVDRHDTYHPFCRYVPMYETLFSATETSFVRMTKDWNNKLYPIFMEDMRTNKNRSRLIKQLQIGALTFIDDVIESMGTSFAELDIEPNKTIRVLDLFFHKPHPRDAQILAGIEFEDSYGGKNKIILSPSDNLNIECVWKEGREALIADQSNKPCIAKTNKNINCILPSMSRKVISSLFNRFLSENKKKKFARDPYLFFSDSKYFLIRKIGKLYLKI
ncbi:MAG: HAD-IA family hydrolase [Campylobacteraceae bacterium]|jgi:HAD superfamily hydrolase (TIGR01549 family)|nr:HAD-IA family hydrolase [Campylobacteraceae bacterium]